jgi:transcriptional regulator with PAS, ATPase and Fis domain
MPGLVVVFSGGSSAARILPLTAGFVELGRSGDGRGVIDDERVSRRHVRVDVKAGRWMVTDLGSHNGTFVDGVRTAAPDTPVRRVIRIGDTLLIPSDDLGPLQRVGVRSVDGFVRGPAMAAVVAEVERIARTAATLHIRGETGTGKEGIAHAFHHASPRAGRALVPVNCATIGESLAERLLFGARRGAFTGAVDQIGYVQQADRSTLFLDEIADLGLQVQAKLLRVLESREVMPVGASTPEKVDFALCSATGKSLRALVGAGALREDFYFRVGTPSVTLPPLRERPEEIPAIVAQVLARRSPALVPHVSLVELCLLRPWPGNVRELIAALAHAAATAGTDSGRVTSQHLPLDAGSVFGSPAVGTATTLPDGASATSGEGPARRVLRRGAEWETRMRDALRDHEGNIAAAARALGIGRTQLRRLMKLYGIQAVRGDVALTDGSGE